VIVAKRVATPLLTVQHQALVHGLRLLDMARIQRRSRGLASPPVDAASLLAGWESDHHEMTPTVQKLDSERHADTWKVRELKSQ
jgi:hypothetical protein